MTCQPTSKILKLQLGASEHLRRMESNFDAPGVCATFGYRNHLFIFGVTSTVIPLSSFEIRTYKNEK